MRIMCSYIKELFKLKNSFPPPFASFRNCAKVYPSFSFLLLIKQSIVCFINYSLFFFSKLGDWHCAYLLLYGPRVLEIPETENEPNS